MSEEGQQEMRAGDPREPRIEDLATRVQRFVNAFLQAILTGEFVLLLVESQWQSATIVLALFAIFLMPTVLNHRLKVFIPAEFQLLVVIFAFAALFMGSIRGLYETYWWWDITLLLQLWASFRYSRVSHYLCNERKRARADLSASEICGALCVYFRGSSRNVMGDL